MFDQYQRHVTGVLRPSVPATLQLVTQLYSGRFWRTTALTTLDTALFLSQLICLDHAVCGYNYLVSTQHRKQWANNIYLSCNYYNARAGQRIIINYIILIHLENSDEEMKMALMLIESDTFLSTFTYSCLTHMKQTQGVLPSAFIRFPMFETHNGNMNIPLPRTSDQWLVPFWLRALLTKQPYKIIE